MNVKILEVDPDEFVDAQVREGKLEEMPSIQEGWRFNFPKHIKRPNSRTFVLVREDSPTTIEGCMVFEMKEKVVPYMAFVEIAPHNRGDERKHDYVAGCLIAYACKLSFEHGIGHHNGFLTFAVSESSEEDEKKLKAVYCSKYGAVQFGELMEIHPKEGKGLIREYLLQSK